MSVAVSSTAADASLASIERAMDRNGGPSFGSGASSGGIGSSSSDAPKKAPRTVRVTFASRNVSARDADDLMLEVQAALFSRGIQFIEKDYLLRCDYNDVVFEIEILRLPRLALHCLNFRRIAGDAWVYQSTYNKILASITM